MQYRHAGIILVSPRSPIYQPIIRLIILVQVVRREAPLPPSFRFTSSTSICGPESEQWPACSSA